MQKRAPSARKDPVVSRGGPTLYRGLFWPERAVKNYLGER
jgi:hypothetical protein